MTNKNTKIIFSHEARAALLKGLNKTADAVGCTLGPKGRTVLIQKGDDLPIVTKDGVTVSKSIRLGDPVEKVGSLLVQEAAQRTNEVAGDGTTTATVLTQAMVNEALKYIVNDGDVDEIKKGVDTAVSIVKKRLATMAMPIKGYEEVEQIATISANGSSHIGKLIATAMKKVGQDGIITVEDAKGMETSVELVEGMQFNRGYLSPYFVTNLDKNHAEYKNAYVLIVNETISDLKPMVPILEQVMSNGRSMIIIANEIDGSALQGLVLNKHKSGLKVVAIKSPGYGIHQGELLSDLAVMTGGDVVSATTGLSLDEVKINNLGLVKNVIATQKQTTIIGSVKYKEKIEKHCSTLRTQLADITLSPQQKDQLQTRIANLANGVATIKVGGTTELEMIERKYRIEDALNATRAAVEEGVVPGGGIALLKATTSLSEMLKDNSELSEDDASFRMGIRLIRTACEEPIKRLAISAGGSIKEVKRYLELSDNKNIGYNASNNTFVDMLKTGIIDPVKVTRTALENAASIVGIFLSMETIIFEEDETDLAISSAKKECD